MNNVFNWHWVRTSLPVFCLIVAGMISTMGCGGGSGSSGTSTTNTSSGPTAEDVLNKMIAAYQGATEYHDNAVVRLRYVEDGKEKVSQPSLNITLKRPNSLYAKIYNAELVAKDGQLDAVIDDPQNKELSEQQLSTTTGPVVTLGTLFQDSVLSNVLQAGVVGIPPQLELLLAADPLEQLKSSSTMKLLEEQTIGGRRCYRIEMDLEQGKRVFWIDKKEYLLRRIDFPDASTDRPGTELSIDFNGAKFSLPENVSWKLGRSGDTVDRFVLPPKPLPTNLVGKVVRGFAFKDLDGNVIDDRSITGKVTLFAWLEPDVQLLDRLRDYKRDPSRYTEPPGRDTIAFLSQLASTTAPFSGDVDTYVVSTLPSKEAIETLRMEMELAGAKIPLLVDENFAGRDRFGVKFSPTLVVLGADGRLQLFDMVTGPDVVSEMPRALRMLIEGLDLADIVLYRQQVAWQRYSRDLLDAGGKPTQSFSKPAGKLDPLHLNLEELWHAEVVAPGDIEVIPAREDRPLKLAVLSGSQTVVELDASGQILGEHRLDLPEGEGVSYLRSAEAKDGRMTFLAARLFGGAAYFFDEMWKKTSQYPLVASAERTLRDSLLADLDGDGTPEAYFGFAADLGVHATDLTGQPIWTFRTQPAVQSLSVTSANLADHRKLLVTGNNGKVYQVNHFGNGEAVNLSQSVSQLYSLPDSEQYCGLAAEFNGEFVALGFNKDFENTWRVSLLDMAYVKETDPVNRVHLLGDKASWLLIRSDGMLSVISPDGSFDDHFCFGHHVYAAAGTYQKESGGILFVSSETGVTAYAVSAKQK